MLENAGSAPWRSRGREGVQLAYHWLDPLGNPIVWDGTRSAFPGVVRPGETVELESLLTAPRPPGRYRLAFDLVEEFRFWFQELGSTPLDLAVDVGRGSTSGASRFACTARPIPRWRKRSRRRRSRSSPRTQWPSRTSFPALSPPPTGHDFCSMRTPRATRAVGGAIDAESRADRRAPGRLGSGRWPQPRFAEPLLLPSLLDGVEPETHDGLPAAPAGDGLFEGRAVVRLRSRSGRPSG